MQSAGFRFAQYNSDITENNTPIYFVLHDVSTTAAEALSSFEFQWQADMQADMVSPEGILDIHMVSE